MKAVKEFGEKRSRGRDEMWKEMLKKDFGHKIFSIKSVTKAKERKQGSEEEEEEEDIDELIDDAFGSDSEEDQEWSVCLN